MEREYSGKFVVRIKPSVHKRLSQTALRAGKSLNEICVAALEDLLNPRPETAANEGGFMRGTVARIKKQWEEKLIGIVLFGSVARGTETKESDIDLLIVLRGETAISRSLYNEWDECMGSDDERDRPNISPHFVRVPDDKDIPTSLWLETALDGIVLWERDFRVSEVLSKLRRKIASDEVIRGESHGQGYWRIR